MTAQALIALIPLLIIASISVVLMLIVSFRRHHRLVNVVTAAGFITAGTMLIRQFGADPVNVTALIILDDYSRFFVSIVYFFSVPAVLFAYGYLEESQDIKEEYYILLSLAVLGAVVVGASSHFVSFFIGLELLSVSLFSMVGYMVKGAHRRLSTLEASIKYMILSGVSSSFLLFGIALVYLNLGTLSFDDIYLTLSHTHITSYGMVGTAMLVIGIAFKLSWVPFHMWTPDVYEGAPVPVTAFLATISKTIVFAIVLRFFVESGSYGYDGLLTVIAIIATISMIVGNGMALLQKNVKRLLAYSSIAHLGYLTIAFVAAGTHIIGSRALSIEAVVFYLVVYVITTWLAFGVVSVLSDAQRGLEAEQLHQFTGLFWHRPWLAAIFTVALLSLAGMPLTAGFIGKFYILSAGIHERLWWLIISMIVGSALGVYYYLNIILEMCKPAPQIGNLTTTNAVPIDNMIVLIGLTALIIALGVFPEPLSQVIKSAIVVLAA